MKRILFIGSMYDQKKQMFVEAKEMGLYVGLVGTEYPEWAQDYIDLYIKANTYDTDSTIKTLETVNISFDGVVTFWDRDVELAAQIAEHFGLRGCGVKAAQVVRNKFKMRQSLSDAGLSNVKYKLITDLNRAISAAHVVGYPLIIKPVSASSSKGIFKVNSDSELNGVKNIIQSTINPDVDLMFSYNQGQFILEQFLEGPEFSVEAIISDNKIHIVGITQKITDSRFEEIQHYFPAPISAKDEMAIKNLVQKAISAIGLNNCGTHTEVKLTDRGPVIVEINGRLGGDYINTHLVPLATGISMVKNTLRAVLGEPVDVDITKHIAASTRFIIPSHEGVIKAWHVNKQLYNDTSLMTFREEKKIGEEVLFPPKAYHDSRVGYVIVTGKTSKAARDKANQLIDDYIEVVMNEA